MEGMKFKISDEDAKALALLQKEKWDAFKETALYEMNRQLSASILIRLGSQNSNEQHNDRLVSLQGDLDKLLETENQWGINPGNASLKERLLAQVSRMMNYAEAQLKRK